MNNPKVSVIVPVYNCAEFLGGCLESLCRQTLKDIEIICINDGSSDSSGQVLKQYAQRDSRITTLTTENHGPGSARNRGMELAKGKYIFFIDSDDMLHRDALSHLLKIAEDTSADIVCGGSKRVKAPTPNDEEELTGNYTFTADPMSWFTAPHTKAPISVWNKLYKREVFKERRFVPDTYYEDLPFTLAAFSEAKSCALSQDRTYLYRNGNTSIMRSKMTLRKIDDYARVCLFIYQDFRKRKLQNEVELLFKNYFSRLNTMILKSFAQEAHFQKHFWEKMSFLKKVGLVPYTRENPVKIAQQSAVKQTESDLQRQKD